MTAIKIDGEHLTCLSSILNTFSFSSLNDSNLMEDPFDGKDSDILLLPTFHELGGVDLLLSDPAEEFLLAEIGGENVSLFDCLYGVTLIICGRHFEFAECAELSVSRFKPAIL